MKYNNELKRIDTQEKAYLLGFMYGDGTITTYKEKTGRIRFLIKISINDFDTDLILALKQLFPFFNTGNFDYSIYGKNTGKQISISKSSKELYQDLMSNGLYPRKSYENKELLKMPTIANELLPHFIRGFFDADGSVYTQKNRPNLIRIEFCSVSKTFAYELDTYLKNIDVCSWEVTPVLPKGKSKQMLYKITFTKTEETVKLIEYMYNGSTIGLERKAKKCLEYKPVDKVSDRNMTCPKCGSNRITKNGIRNGNNRYVCQECKKGFTVKTNFN
jgi:hypothetical protein